MKQGHFTIAWGFYQFSSLGYDNSSKWLRISYQTSMCNPHWNHLESSRLLPSMWFWPIKMAQQNKLHWTGCTTSYKPLTMPGMHPRVVFPWGVLKKSNGMCPIQSTNMLTFLETSRDFVRVFPIWLLSGKILVIYCQHLQQSVVIYDIPLLYRLYRTYPTVYIIA